MNDCPLKLTCLLKLWTCRDDRWVWLEALKAAKGAWDGLTPTAAGALTHITPRSSLNADRRFHSIVAEVRERLARMGTSAEAQAYVTSVLEQQHQEFHELALADENKRHSLLDIIYQLENEKRQLETALVVEGRTAADRSPHAASIGSLATAGAEFAEAGAVPGSSEADDDNSGQQGPPSTGSTGGLDRLDSMGGQLHEEEEEEEFFECDTVSLRSHSRSTSMTDLAELLEAASVSPPASGDAGSGAPPAEKARAPPSGAVAVAAGAANGVSAHAPTPRDVSASVPEWLAAESAPQRRTHLPPPLQREKSISLWALIKEMVGKDLTRVCLPVYFNEPLSALEKTAEDLEYSELLDQAAALPPGSVDRLLRIAAFAVSAYSSTVGRIAKPFNPLLGETYELVHPEKGFRFVSEKVSHHPTIIAAHAEGRGWTFEGDAEVKSKFWGRSIELKPEGVLRLQFADGDTYVWNKVTTSINNLILGKIYVDHGGIMRVRNLRPGGLTARIRFKETGMLFDKDPRQVKGFLERGGQRLERPMLFGHWDDAVCAELEDGSTIELWKKAPPPPDPTRYNLTQFAIQLNELTPGLRDKIAPTDCRLRPDQAFTERGMWDEANAEKQRLEHKQRAARRAADRGDPIRPRWFTVLPAASAGAKREAHELAFQYNGGYWEARAEGRYDGCRDIFGQHVEGE